MAGRALTMEELYELRWRVEVPYRDRRTKALVRERYPASGTYHLDEAKDILQIFCKRWLEARSRPPAEIEPFAVAADDPAVVVRLDNFFPRIWGRQAGPPPIPTRHEEDPD